MKKQFKLFLIGCVLIGYFFGTWTPFALKYISAYRDSFGVIHLPFWETVTLISLSPDKSRRIILVEKGRPIYGDRYFDLRLQMRYSREIKTVFRATDQQMPAGSERVVWSLDSSRFILIARNINVEDLDAPWRKDNPFIFENGEIVKMLYDTESNQLYIGQCSAAVASVCLPLSPNVLDDFQQGSLP